MTTKNLPNVGPFQYVQAHDLELPDDARTPPPSVSIAAGETISFSLGETITLTEERLPFDKYPFLHDLGTQFDDEYYRSVEVVFRVGDTLTIEVRPGGMLYAREELKRYAGENPGTKENCFSWRGMMIEVKQRQ